MRRVTGTRALQLLTLRAMVFGIAGCREAPTMVLLGRPLVLQPYAAGASCSLQLGLVSCDTVLAVPGSMDTPAERRVVPGVFPALKLIVDLTGSTACVVRADRTLRCWGVNSWGALGRGRAPTPGEAVLEISGPEAPHDLPPVVDVAAGQLFFCALDAVGGIWCWGRNEFGQVAAMSPATVPTPVAVDGIPPAVEVVASVDQACARTEHGEVWCWGDADVGTPHTPRRVVEGASHLRLERDHICATTGDGESCWDAAPTLHSLSGSGE